MFAAVGMATVMVLFAVVIIVPLGLVSALRKKSVHVQTEVRTSTIVSNVPSSLNVCVTSALFSLPFINFKNSTFFYFLIKPTNNHMCDVLYV